MRLSLPTASNMPKRRWYKSCSLRRSFVAKFHFKTIKEKGMTAMAQALSNEGILQLILSYEGPGSWLFISPVCKLWKHWYEQLDPVPLRESYPHADIRLTAYGAAFESLSRLRLACECGLQALFANEILQQRAGSWCDVPTLLAAQELGLKVTNSFMRYAAAAGRLDVLQLLHTDQGVQLPADVGGCASFHARKDVLRWLQEVGSAFNERTATGAASGGHAAVLLWLIWQGCPLIEREMCGYAAGHGHLNILCFLQEHGLLAAQQHLSEALQVAGAYGELAVAQWLRLQDVEWPAVLKCNNKPWQGEVLAWARAEGCTSPTETEHYT
jgi:hypothetical protein